MIELFRLKETEIIFRFENLVAVERKTTAEVVSYIREIERRKIYLNLGFTSLFAYLTKKLKYSPASAQRRIEAARLLNELPQLKSDLEKGDLNLTQISMVAQNIKAAQEIRKKEALQKPQSVNNNENVLPIRTTLSAKITTSEKLNLINAIKGQDAKSSQRILSQSLDIPVQIFEKSRIQQDESVRAEMTFTKEQMELLNRVKELISHTHPNPKLSDVFEKLAQFYIEKKDPRASENPVTRSNFRSEVTLRQSLDHPKPEKPKRKYLSRKHQRLIFKRDQSCQWQDPKTNHVCGSRFKLEIDHINSVWRGGRNDFENLQLLCATHNKLKFRLGG